MDQNQTMQQLAATHTTDDGRGFKMDQHQLDQHQLDQHQQPVLLQPAQQQQLEQQQQNQQQPQQSTNGPKPRGRRRKIRTEPIRPICPQCEKQFSNQSALTKHKLTHSDERKFACQECSKAFKRHDHLTGHMQTHSKRKPYNCTIPGCDKTYCDARSLRRHKENIHHIITPRELNGTGNQHHNGHHHHHHHQHASLSADYASTQRFVFDQAATESMNGAEAASVHHLDQHSLRNSCPMPSSADSVTTDSGLDLNAHCKQLSLAGYHQQQQQPSTPQQHQSQSHLNQAQAASLQQLPTQQQPPQQLQNLQPSHLLKRRIQRLHSDQGPSSCNRDSNDSLFGRGYLACNTAPVVHSPLNSIGTQHVPLTGNDLHHHDNQYLNNHHHQHASYSADYASKQHFDFANMNGHHHNHNHPQHHHHMDHAISSSTVSLSADSVTDSGLDLNYEQLTPSYNQQPQQQQSPQVIAQQQQQQQHQQTTQMPQPLQLQPLQQQQQQQQQRYQQQQLQQHAYSADYASKQHFDFANMNGHLSHHHVDHAISSSTMGLSADSVTDSGLDLKYEQLTPGYQQQPPQKQQQTQPQQQQQQQQHQTHLPPPLQLHQLQPQQRYQQHVSYSAGYANAQHFDFAPTTPLAINGSSSSGGSLATCSSTVDRDINNNLVDEQHTSYVTYVSQEEELRSS